MTSLKPAQVRKYSALIIEFLTTIEKPRASELKSTYMKESKSFCQLHASAWSKICEREHGIYHRLALLSILIQHMEIWNIALKGMELCDLQAKVCVSQSLALYCVDCMLCRSHSLLLNKSQMPLHFTQCVSICMPQHTLSCNCHLALGFCNSLFSQSILLVIACSAFCCRAFDLPKFWQHFRKPYLTSLGR